MHGLILGLFPVIYLTATRLYAPNCRKQGRAGDRSIESGLGYAKLSHKREHFQPCGGCVVSSVSGLSKYRIFSPVRIISQLLGRGTDNGRIRNKFRVLRPTYIKPNPGNRHSSRHQSTSNTMLPTNHPSWFEETIQGAVLFLGRKLSKTSYCHQQQRILDPPKFV